MGIQDRDYVRREGTSYLGSFLERGKVCKWLIGINVVVFLLQMATNSPPTEDGSGFNLTRLFDLNVYQTVFEGQVWRLVTHMFLHQVSRSIPTHIIFNMAFLWWFGSDVEDLYGPHEFLAIYLVGGLASAAAFVATSLPIVIGLTDAALSPAAIGASGAVTAVLVIFACHYPTKIIYVMFVIPVPIWLFVLFTVLYDAFTLASGVNTGVAVAGHLGGAAFGFAYYKLHWRLSGLWPNLSGWRKRRSQPRLRVYREPDDKPTPVGVAATAPPLPPKLEDEHLEAKMDAVLEKLSREGKDNLTDSDKAILQKASEILRKRRS